MQVHHKMHLDGNDPQKKIKTDIRYLLFLSHRWSINPLIRMLKSHSMEVKSATITEEEVNLGLVFLLANYCLKLLH